MLLGIFGILASLALLIVLAYRGVPVIVAAPIAAAVCILLAGAPLMASYTEIFMPALGNFVKSYFPVFLLGAVFGTLMTVTGYAESIARTISGKLGAQSAIAATVITAALMSYGGISLFVVAFVMYPVARELFRVADIPRRLVPATIALGIFTFTMTALPGTPQIQNVIPGKFFGTSTYAAPIVGILGSLMIFGLGMAWLEFRKRQLIAAGEHFSSIESAYHDGGFGGGHADSAPAASATTDTSGPAQASTAATVATTVAATGPGMDDEALAAREALSGAMTYTGNRLIPFLPLLTVAIVNFLCTLVIFPAMNFDYLSEEKFGGIALKDRAGLWAVIVAILVAIALVYALNMRHHRKLNFALSDGARKSLLPIFSTGSEVGYGAVVASVAAFVMIRDAVFNLHANALITSVLSTSVTAGLTGSSSGGMTIALNAFGEQLRDLAVAEGMNLEFMHRLTAMAAGGIDTLPHSGAVITLLMVCGLSHRQSYKDIGIITLVIPVITVATLVTGVSIFA